MTERKVKSTRPLSEVPRSQVKPELPNNHILSMTEAKLMYRLEVGEAFFGNDGEWHVREQHKDTGNLNPRISREYDSMPTLRHSIQDGKFFITIQVLGRYDQDIYKEVLLD